MRTPGVERWEFEETLRAGNPLELKVMSRQKINISWKSVSRHEDEARDF